MTAQQRQCIKGPDRCTSSPNTACIATAITVDGWHDLAHQTLIETVLRGGSIRKRTTLLQPCLTGDRINGVDLQSQISEEITDRRDHVKTLGLFGIATRSRKQQ